MVGAAVVEMPRAGVVGELLPCPPPEATGGNALTRPSIHKNAEIARSDPIEAIQRKRSGNGKKKRRQLGADFFGKCLILLWLPDLGSNQGPAD